MTSRIPPSDPIHPIRIAALRTGLTPDLLRAWEKRYGVVNPGRSDGGQRLYSDSDIERLRLLSGAVEHGRSIGQIAELDDETLRQMIRDDLEGGAQEGDRIAEAAHRRETSERATFHMSLAYDAVERMDALGLDGVLRNAMGEFSAEEWIREVIGPLVKRIGDEWHRGNLTVAQEHLATATIRQSLGRILTFFAPARDAPVVTVATPETEIHELGAMMVASTAASAGWKSIYIGPDLPASEIVTASQRLGARVVALSLVFPNEPPVAEQCVRDVARNLPSDVELWIGGQASLRISREIGVDRIGDLAQLRNRLLAAHDPTTFPAGS